MNYLKRALIVFAVFQLNSELCSAQNTAQFKTFNDNLITQKWDVTVKGFRLSDNLFLVMSQNDYSSLVTAVKEIPIYFKYSVNDKVNILAGAKLDIHTNRNTGVQQFGVSTSLGLQYDFNENTYFQAVFDYQLKQVDNPYHYNYQLPASFSFKSGFKF
jgi:hypothetical protein